MYGGDQVSRHLVPRCCYGSEGLVSELSLIFCATGPDGVQVMWSDQSSAERIGWKEGCELLLSLEEIAESL